MKILFSDRVAPLAILLSLGAFAGLELNSYDYLKNRYSNFRRCFAEPEAHHDKQVRLMAAEIVGEGRVRKDDFDIPVRGLPPCRPGDHVRMVGRFHKDGYVESISADVVRNYGIKRSLMFAVSLAVLATLLLLLRRRLAGSLRDGFFEERRHA